MSHSNKPRVYFWNVYFDGKNKHSLSWHKTQESAQRKIDGIQKKDWKYAQFLKIRRFNEI